MRTVVVRDVGLDRVRGVAVVLMVVDHVAKYVLPVEPRWLTLTVTRMSLPLFMVTLGVLLGRRAYGIRIARLVQVAACGLVTSLVFAVMGAAVPDVLLVIALTATVWEGCQRWPEVMACLGFAQASALPIAWSGYQPGFVVLLICVGVLSAGGGRWSAVGVRLPAFFSGVGRRPLMVYVGHVLALPVLQSLVR